MSRAKWPLAGIPARPGTHGSTTGPVKMSQGPDPDRVHSKTAILLVLQLRSTAQAKNLQPPLEQDVGGGTWDVECGMWNVGGGMWDVECGMWEVGCGMWNVECV